MKKIATKILRDNTPYETLKKIANALKNGGRIRLLTEEIKMDNFFSNLNSFINEKCWNATFSYSAQVLFLDFGYTLKEDLGSFGYCYSEQYSIHLDCQWRPNDDNVSLCGYDDSQEAILETTDGHPFWVVTDNPDLEHDYSAISGSS